MSERRGALAALGLALLLGCGDDAEPIGPTVPPGVETLHWSRHDSPIGGGVSGIVAAGDVALAVVRDEGVYRSGDGGEAWERLSSYPDEPPWTEPHALTACDGEFLIASGGGVLRSSDAGESWQESRTDDVWGLASTGRSVMAVEFGGGVFLSPDCGRTWQARGTASSGSQDVAHVGGSSWLLASFAGVSLSTDDGQTWRVVLSLPVASMVFVSSSGRAFAAARTGGFHYSDDLETWTEVPGEVPGWPAFAERLAESSSGTLFSAFDIALSRSTDGGATWTRLAWTSSDHIDGLAWTEGALLIGAEDGAWLMKEPALPRLVGPSRLVPRRGGVTRAGTPFAEARSGPLASSVYFRHDGDWGRGEFREVALGGWVEAAPAGLLLGLRSREEPGLGRVVRSVDDGRSWQAVLQGVEPGGIVPYQGGLYMLADALPELTSGAGVGGLWRSGDGSSWQRIDAPPTPVPYQAIDLVALPERGLILLLRDPIEGGDELWLRRPGGLWQPLPVPSDPLIGIGTLAGGRLAAADAHTVHVADDPGGSWESHPAPEGAAIRDIASAPGWVAIATDRGLFASADGSTWQAIHPDEADFGSVAISGSGAVVATTLVEVHVGLP